MHNNLLNSVPNHLATIGAGISGLPLGRILQEAKIPVVRFEKSNNVSDYGAGISISPNGIKILKNLNIYDEIVSVSANPKAASFYSQNKKINSFNVNVLTTSRQVLYKYLYKKYNSLGGEVIFEHE